MEKIMLLITEENAKRLREEEKQKVIRQIEEVFARQENNIETITGLIDDLEKAKKGLKFIQDRWPNRPAGEYASNLLKELDNE